MEDKEQFKKDQKARYDYWAMLRQIRYEYDAAVGDNAGMTGPTFEFWLEDTYGLRMILDSQGNYTSDYTVVDNKRFLMLKLKHNF